MQTFKSSTTTVIELRFFMKKKKTTKMKMKMKNLIYLYFIPHVTFSSMHEVNFLNVLHLADKLKVNILMYGYNAGPHMAIPIYTV